MSANMSRFWGPLPRPAHAGLLDALGVGPVVAVGHSAGAIVCMELAQRQPRRVAGKPGIGCAQRWHAGWPHLAPSQLHA